MTKIASAIGFGMLPGIVLSLLAGPIIFFFAFRLAKTPISYMRSFRLFLGYFFITFIADLPALLFHVGPVPSLILSVTVDILVGVSLIKWRLDMSFKKAVLSFGMAYAVLFSIHYVSTSLWSIDDELDPNAQQALEQPKATKPFGENLFVALIGLNDQQKDPIAVGTKIIETHEANLDTVHGNLKSYSHPQPQTQGLKFENSDTEIIESAQFFSPGDMNALAKIYDKNPALMANYKKLRDYSFYENPMTPSLVQPHVDGFSLILLNRVALGKAFFGLSSGDYEKFVRDLRNELDLFRFVQRNAENIPNIMFPRIILKKTILAYEKLLDDPGFVQSGTFLEEAHLTLTDEDTSIVRAILYEYRTLAHMALSFNRDAVRMLKSNMTINYAYELYGEMKDDMARPPRQIVQLFSKEYNHKHPLLDILRNPIGSSIAEKTVESVDFLKFRLQSIDIGATFRLVHIKQLIRAQNVPHGEIGAFVRKLPSELKNPYTLRPFEWDAAGGILSCTRKGKYRDEVLSIEIPELDQVPSPPQAETEGMIDSDT